MFEFRGVISENISSSDSVRLTQHGPFGLRWHLDRVKLPVSDRPLPFSGTEILARGRTLVIDGPRGDGSVVRWMGPTAALATLSDSIKPLDSSLQVTSVVVVPAQPGRSSEVNLILLHAMSGISVTDVDVSDLILPTGYTEVPWRGFEHASGLPKPSSEFAAHWRAPLARP